MKTTLSPVFRSSGGYHPARVAEESGLIPFIERGYEIVKVLGDGKYIMRRPNRH